MLFRVKAPWGERYRIHGIDAPELTQECERDGTTYPCGLEAKQALEVLVDGKETVCEPVEQDRYGRTVARCTADGLDVGEEMVRRRVGCRPQVRPGFLASAFLPAPVCPTQSA